MLPGAAPRVKRDLVSGTGLTVRGLRRTWVTGAVWSGPVPGFGGYG